MKFVLVKVGHNKSLCSKFQSAELIFEEDIEIFENDMQFAMFIELRIDVKSIKILSPFVTRPIFVGTKGIKVNAKNYEKYLRTQLFPFFPITAFYPRNDWIYL